MVTVPANAFWPTFETETGLNPGILLFSTACSYADDTSVARLLRAIANIIHLIRCEFYLLASAATSRLVFRNSKRPFGERAILLSNPDPVEMRGDRCEFWQCRFQNIDFHDFKAAINQSLSVGPARDVIGNNPFLCQLNTRNPHVRSTYFAARQVPLPIHLYHKTLYPPRPGSARVSGAVKRDSNRHAGSALNASGIQLARKREGWLQRLL